MSSWSMYGKSICKNPKRYIWNKDTTTQVGFAELKETADNRANIGGTIIGAKIIGQ